MMAKSNDAYELVLACTRCGKEVRTDSRAKVLKASRMTHKMNRERLNASMIYDMSLRKTARISCPQEACPSRSSDLWGGQVPETGVVVQPAVAVTNFTSRDRVGEYICLVCRSTFKVDTMQA
jgi:DNA-directed RNA polymerase subunit RPC12/RpoP